MQLFSDSSELGSKVTFPYVIYSKKNMNKYIKHLKKNKIHNLDQVLENENDNPKSLFFKYLKSLSS